MNKKLIIALVMVACVLAAAPTSAPSALTVDLCNSASDSAANGITTGFKPQTTAYVLVNNVCTACPTGCKCTDSAVCTGCLNPRDIFVDASTKVTPATKAQCYSALTDTTKVTTNSAGCDVPCVEAGTAANLCSKCSAAFYNKAGICTTCGTNCASCNSPVGTAAPVCLTCTAGFYVKDGACGTACTFSDTNCAACGADGKTCTVCKADYQLIAGACVSCKASAGAKTCTAADKIQDCRDGYFYTAASGTTAATCTACDSNCRLCTGTKQCTACNKGSVATDDWVGLYWDTTTTACKACTTPANTIYCNSSGDSVVCGPGYIAIDKKCQAVIPNCTTHGLATTDVICTACATGYYYTGGACVKFSNTDKCTTAVTQATTKAGTFTGCSACSAGYGIPSSSVGYGCFPLDPNVKTSYTSGTDYDPANTVTKSNVIYLKTKLCKSATYLLGGEGWCYDITPYGTTAPAAGATTGIVCQKTGPAACTNAGDGCAASGAVLLADGTTCAASCPDGWTADANKKCAIACNATTNCSACPIADTTAPYYKKSDNTCVVITDAVTLANCKTYSTTGGCTDCTKVSTGFLVKAAADTNSPATCIACSDSTLNSALGVGCGLCSSATVCTACKDDTYTLQGAKCLAADSNCQKSLAGICVACKTGTYFDSTAGTCTKTCDATAGCSVTSGKNCDLTVVAGGNNASAAKAASSGSFLTFAFSAIVLILAALF